MKPMAVRIAAALAGLESMLMLVAVGWTLANTGHNADTVVRRNPEITRHVALVGSYSFAVFSAGLAVAFAVAAVELSRARRWAWILLFVLSAVGLLGAFRVHSALGALSLLLDACLFLMLVQPASRAYVRDRSRPTQPNAA